MRRRDRSDPPIPLADLVGRRLPKDVDPAVASWVVVPPEWIQFSPGDPAIGPGPLPLVNEADARRGLAFMLDALGVEGMALGHRGWILCKHAEVIGRELREQDG